MSYFFALERAFYVEQRDLTRAEVLADIAAEQGMDREAFLQHWGSEAMHEKTQRNFQMTQEAGVRGFPTVVMQDQNGFELLTTGFRPYEQLQPQLAAWLEKSLAD